MTWFKRLTGIDDQSPDHVRSRLAVDGEHLVFPDGKRIAFGRLETVTLAELRSRAEPRTRADAVDHATGTLRLREVVGDVRHLHADESNADALFQVASQFNLLEMTSPSVTPESGVGIYELDPTQGPACAISCGAGTIYRNYFAPIGDSFSDSIGQSANRQIDCSADAGALLGNDGGQLWVMRNGYLLPSDQGLGRITEKLRSADEAELDRYRTSLRIGLQWRTAVTLAGASHRVSQAYCSALPVAYGRQPQHLWAEFACLVLEAAYESTICAAILNRTETGSNKLYLTLLGGGVFGNHDDWIIDAIHRALSRYRHHDLDVAVVSYRCSHPAVAKLVRRFAEVRG